jgi:predicted RND superfamily exporter protein
VRIHDRIEAAFEVWGRFVVRHRVAVALVMLAVSAAACAFLPHLEADNSTESFLRPNDPARLHYDRFREQFGQDERIVLAIRPPEIFEFGFLERLRALHQEIERRVPYVEEITSLWNVRNVRGEGDRLVVEDLMEDWPATPEDLAALRARVLETPVYRNTLVNEELTLTTLVIEPFIYSTFDDAREPFGGFEDTGALEAPPEFLSEDESIEQLAALEQVVARYRAPDFEIFVAGNVVMTRAATKNLMHDVTVALTAGTAVMALLLFVLFRRVLGVILPLLVVLLAVAVTYGVMALVGLPTSLSGQVLPTLVLAVGLCSAVHVLTIMYQQLARGASREDAIVAALGHSGLAISMASLTTAVGLLSFLAAELAQVQNLGIAAPIGIVLSFVYCVTLLPALLALVPQSSSRLGDDALQQRLAARLVRVGDFATDHPFGVLAVTAVLVLVGGFGVAQLRFSQNALVWFPEDDPVRLAAEFLNDELGSAGGVEVWIDTGLVNGLHDPDLLRRIDEAMRFADTLEEGGGELFTGKTLSIVDVVKETHKALNENRHAFYAIPNDRQLLAQELLLFENSGSDDLEDFTDSQFQMARVSLHTPFVNGMLYVPFMERIEAGFREILGDGAELRITGLGALFARSFSVMNVTMARSYIIALLIITPLMILLIGELRRGLLSMIPNLVPIWLTLGLMGWRGVALDNSTLLVGCILIGLAVDDTIHFMHRFQRYHAAGYDARSAVRRTLSTTGSALLFTTLVLAAGFLAMTLCYMNNAVIFGQLAVFAAITAFVADVTISPALMVLASRRVEAQADLLATGKTRATVAAD